ncbi:MAG: tetratricopeptide repeat protein [Acidobacteriota bacterium]
MTLVGNWRYPALGLSCLASWLVSAAVGASSGSSLPPEDCVAMMRGARIARMGGDEAVELQKLQAALEACPRDISPIYELLRYYRRSAPEAARHRQFVERLTERLADPEYELQPGVLEYLIRDPEAGEVEQLAILGNVARQVDGVEGVDPRLLRIRAALERRAGRPEAAAVTLERLWRETRAEDLLLPLVGLYRDLERWQDAADLLAPRAGQDPGGYLHLSYLRILGKLGRYQEVLRQTETLATAVRADGAEVDASDLHGALEQIAWDLRDLGQDAEAEQLFRRLLSEAPDDASLQAAVLHLYASEDERKRHAAALDVSWKEETDPNALLEEGTQRLTSGDAAGAIDLLRRAAAEFPELEAVWYNLGLAAYKLEDWSTVESALGRSTELNSQRTQSFLYRGLALEKLGRCEEAVQALESCVALDDSQAIAYYYLYACHAKLGDQAAAQAARSRYEALQN